MLITFWAVVRSYQVSKRAFGFAIKNEGGICLRSSPLLQDYKPGSVAKKAGFLSFI